MHTSPVLSYKPQLLSLNLKIIISAWLNELLGSSWLCLAMWYGYRHMQIFLAFSLVLGIQTQVLLVVYIFTCPLRHLSHPFQRAFFVIYFLFTSFFTYSLYHQRVFLNNAFECVTHLWDSFSDSTPIFFSGWSWILLSTSPLCIYTLKFSPPWLHGIL